MNAHTPKRLVSELQAEVQRLRTELAAREAAAAAPASTPATPGIGEAGSVRAGTGALVVIYDVECRMPERKLNMSGVSHLSFAGDSDTDGERDDITADDVDRDLVVVRCQACLGRSTVRSVLDCGRDVCCIAAATAVAGGPP